MTHDLEVGRSPGNEVVSAAGSGQPVVAVFPSTVRPRNLMDIRTDPRFVDLYRTIWSILREEVLKSYERSRHMA